MIKKYIFATLDFIFDEKEDLYFLEANSVPGGMSDAEEVFKGYQPMKEVADFMKKQGEELCVISTSRKTKFWVYSHLKRYLPNLRLCYREDNRTNRTYLIDVNNEKFKPSCIYRNGNLICTSFESKIPVINPKSVVNITLDKIKTYKLVSKHVNIPEFYVIRNKKQLNSKIKEFGSDFVVKGVCGSYGDETYISKKTGFGYPCILQKRIFPKKIKNQFWDVRVFIIDGKYNNAVVRLSKNPVTNFCCGAKASFLPKRLENKIRNVSEKIVRVIDLEARK
jgi:glutathione synthase/RimK-type ligase-like ATP-grasp enzyme